MALLMQALKKLPSGICFHDFDDSDLHISTFS